MASEEQYKKSRVVVETPNTRREVVRSETETTPERSGLSGGTVAALVVGAVALVVVFFLFMMNRQQEEQAAIDNLQATAAAPSPIQQQPVIVQQPAPAPQQPVIIQQPAPPSSQPIIVAPGAAGPQPSTASVTDDLSVQSTIDKRLKDDSTLSSIDLTATVIDGKVTLIGMVNSEDLKARAERVVQGVKGVKSIDNQIVVSR
jgi:hyperosmotically inducible protein